MKITLMRMVLVFAGLLTLLVVALLRQPPVILDKTTTYITEPLKPDGLPNYLLHFEDARRAGVRKEENAAIDFWKAVGPEEGIASNFKAICRELGIDSLPSSFLKMVESKEVCLGVADFVRSAHGGQEFLVFGQSPDMIRQISAISGSGSFGSNAWAESLVQQSCVWPWGTEDLPLGDWIEENRDSLNLLVAASKKPKFYSPSISYLSDRDQVAYYMSLDATQQMRLAIHSLATRCMFRIHEGRLDEAIDEASAIGRLARFQRGSFPVERRIEIEFRQVCFECFNRILASRKITYDQADSCEQALAGLDPVIPMLDAVDGGERLVVLDAALRALGPNMDSLHLEFSTTFLSIRKTVNKNRVLQELNRWYDRLVEIAKIDDKAVRLKSLAAFNADLERTQSADNLEMGKKLTTRRGRSKFAADYLFATFVYTSSQVSAPDIDATRRTVMLVAAALVKHRLRHGSYPNKLDELDTEVECVDVYRDPLVYRLRPDGFLLYALGPNRKDDNGSQIPYPKWHVNQGEWANGFVSQEPGSSDDVVVRFPEPEINWHQSTPWLPSP